MVGFLVYNNLGGCMGWVVDLEGMTCRNTENDVVVQFEQKGKGKALAGEIKYVPMKLFAEWAAEPNGEKKLYNAVSEAEDVFTRAWIERDLEK